MLLCFSQSSCDYFSVLHPDTGPTHEPNIVEDRPDFAIDTNFCFPVLIYT